MHKNCWGFWKSKERVRAIKLLKRQFGIMWRNVGKVSLFLCSFSLIFPLEALKSNYANIQYTKSYKGVSLIPRQKETKWIDYLNKMGTFADGNHYKDGTSWISGGFYLYFKIFDDIMAISSLWLVNKGSKKSQRKPVILLEGSEIVVSELQGLIVQ